MAKLGEHAVVLGASMGGLLAARVLADFYDDGHRGRAGRAARRSRRTGGGFRRAATCTPCWDVVPRSWLSCFPGSSTNSSRPEPLSWTTPTCPKAFISFAGHQADA